MGSVNLILQHGWGFNQNIWKGWNEGMPTGVLTKYCDRGYFGQPSAKEAAGKTVLVTHSFGLHLVPPEILEKASGLVLISGFLHFHPEDEKAEERSRLLLRRMTNGVGKNPKEVLEWFYQTCQVPFAPSSFVNRPLLAGDLERLDQEVMSTEKLQHLEKVIILHGTEDSIVPIEKGQELHEQLPQSIFLEIQGAEHGLPQTHRSDCQNAIGICVEAIR